MLNWSDRRRASSTNPWWHSTGSDHVIGKELRRAVRIWARTNKAHHAPGATRPSVARQSVFCLDIRVDHDLRTERKNKYGFEMRKQNR